MARQLYSYSFLIETITVGGVVVVPLDPADLYVVRDVSAFFQTPSDDALALRLLWGPYVLLHLAAPGHSTTSHSWQGHIVAPGTNSLQAEVLGGSGSIDVAVSGYRLTP